MRKQRIIPVILSATILSACIAYAEAAQVGNDVTIEVEENLIEEKMEIENQIPEEVEQERKVITGEKNILNAYLDSAEILKDCTSFEYDVIATATAEVYLGHEQNKHSKFTRESCAEEGIPFELTERQLDTIDSYLLGNICSFSYNYWTLSESGEDFENKNKENADVYIKLYISSPEYPEFKFEMEMYDKHVKINETVNIKTGEIIPESYFDSERGMFESMKGFCQAIKKKEYLEVNYEGFDLENRTFNGEELDYIEKCTFDIDVTEDLYYGFFKDITDINETVKAKLEQFKWETAPSGCHGKNMYIFTFEGNKGKIIFTAASRNDKERLIYILPDCVYDEENKLFIEDEGFDPTDKMFGLFGRMKENGEFESLYLFKGYSRGPNIKKVYAKNIEYEFYKDMYKYNNCQNLFAEFYNAFTYDMRPETITIPEPVNGKEDSEITEKEKPEYKEEKEEEKKSEKKEEKEEEKQEQKEPEKEEKPKPEKITVYINGEKVEFDQDPIIKENRTLVPMRAIFEALGAEVKWNEAMRTVTAIKDGTVITMKISEENMYKNGETITLEAAPTIVNSRTLVPVRAIAESFGNEVSWDAEEMRVDVE